MKESEGDRGEIRRSMREEDEGVEGERRKRGEDIAERVGGEGERRKRTEDELKEKGRG